VLLFSTGAPRACWSPWNRNYPGFPDGISGAELVQRFQQQAETFNVRTIPERVERITRSGDSFELSTDQQTVQARRVILATGTRDSWPDVPDVERLAGRYIRVCPICDGYEGNGRRVGIIGCGDKPAREALYLRQWSDDVTLFSYGDRAIDPELLERVRKEGVNIIDAPLSGIEPRSPDAEHEVSVHLRGGEQREIDLLFSALGCGPRSELVRSLGARLDEDGYIQVDAMQATSVPGLYAVGDVASSINQVTVAVGQAAIAATAVHNGLLDF